MKHARIFHRKGVAHLLLPLAIGLAIGGCDDPLEVEDHIDVEGFVLFEGATEIYRYSLDDGTPPPLELVAATHDVLFVPLGHDGELMTADDADYEEELELRITISDTEILRWTPEAGGTGAHDFIEFPGELTGVRAGTTTMLVCVPHGDHCDFEAAVPVTVTAP
ncbi:MAG: hypothetical protein ACOC3J_04065 [Gemmatimonadota bacterium]